MSVNRYNHFLRESSDGEWVCYDDYAALENERDALKRQLQNQDREYLELEREIKYLERENEELRYALGSGEAPC